MRRVIILGSVATAAASIAACALAAPSKDMSSYADPSSIVLAIEAPGAAPGGKVRLVVYADERNFLESPLCRHFASVDKDGVAVLSLRDLTPGDYAFVAYYDENGDGQLNRSALGRPKEPYVFSNGVKPRLRKPRFSDAKIGVALGDVVALRLGA
jgi:uncharacterized protein (DUF2141 family)